MSTQRTLCWLGFFTVAGVLAWLPERFGQPADGEVPVAVREPVASAAARPTTARKSVAAVADLFAPKSWKPAVAVATVVEQPQAAAPMEVALTAPPMPFQFIGRLNDRHDEQVFLQDGERLHVVRRGDVIDNTWRLERVSGDQLELTYLPLHLSQTLSTGGAP